VPLVEAGMRRAESLLPGDYIALPPPWPQPAWREVRLLVLEGEEVIVRCRRAPGDLVEPFRRLRRGSRVAVAREVPD
jgi:hypothetical protein